MENLLDLCLIITNSKLYYYKPNSGTEDDGDNAIEYSIKSSVSFDYKASITGKLEDDDVEKDVETAIPLKYLRNFWRNLDMLLINCEISLTLSWYRKCVLTIKAWRLARGDPPVLAINNPRDTFFAITDCKLYVPVVTLSSEEDKELLNQLKSGFERTIKWKKYMSQMSGIRTSFSNYYVPNVEIKGYNVIIDGNIFF